MNAAVDRWALWSASFFLTEDTPRDMIQTGPHSHIARCLSQTQLWKQTDGDSGRFWERRLSFLPNSAEPDRHRDPAQREYTLVFHVLRSPNNWTLLTLSPVSLQDDELLCFRDMKPGATHHYLVVTRTHIDNCKSLQWGDIPLGEGGSEQDSGLSCSVKKQMSHQFLID